MPLGARLFYEVAMIWSDLASRFFKIAIALLSAVVMDYAFLDGRMTAR
jgi:hypothetical protein